MLHDIHGEKKYDHNNIYINFQFLYYSCSKIIYNYLVKKNNYNFNFILIENTDILLNTAQQSP